MKIHIKYIYTRMKKVLLLIPFILAIYAVSTAVVDNSFSSKKVTINTTIFKSLDQVKTVKAFNRAPIVAVKVPGYNFNDVENLNFNNPVVKEENVKKKKLVSNVNFEQKVINKKIEDFNLTKKDFKIAKKESKKEKVNNNIIELDITEKVNVYAYSKTIEIKKTNWSAIFEYSPAKIKEVKEVELNQPVLAKKETYKENMDTPIRISNLKKVKAEKIKEDNKTDRISTVLAATEKSIVKVESQLKISKNNRELEVKVMQPKIKEDLVFFNYTAAEKDLNNQKIVKTGVNNPASKVNVASKVTKKKPVLDFSNIGKLKKPKKKAVPVVAQAKVKDNKIVVHESETVKMAESFLNTQKSQKHFKVDKRNYNGEYSIQPYDVNGTRKKKDVSHFEVRFDDDIDDIIQSYGEGQINLKTKINSEMSIRRGTIYSASHYPTTVDFVLENNEVVAKIPMLQKTYINKLITQNGLTGFGGQLLVELDNLTEDVDIDAKYEKKIFLNKYLQQVERGEDDYSFILFIGADTGNTIISFKTIKNKTVSKIIHIEDEELYYEPNFYVEKTLDDFELSEEYLLSKDKGPLSLDPRNIVGLTFGNKFKKLTNNRYRLNKVQYPLGMRSYIELKHLQESVYVGRWNNKVVTVPSEQYMRHVLNNFNMKGVGSSCLVQVNLPKQANELFFNGQSKSGSMRMQVRILDKDGIFYTDLSNESEKIFLLGEEQGIINIKVKYVDGSLDYLQSYCSDNTYLVEQL